MEKIILKQVTNLLKMVHGWQNNGQQKDLFYENNEDSWCMAGCGQTGKTLYFVRCMAPRMRKPRIKWRSEFKGCIKFYVQQL